jgi:hypothetical protein
MRSRRQKTDQFCFLLWRQRFGGSFNLKQRIHAESLAPDIFQFKRAKMNAFPMTEGLRTGIPKKAESEKAETLCVFCALFAAIDLHVAWHKH